MNKAFWSTQGAELRVSPWLAALLGIVVVKAVVSLAVESVPFVFSYSGISYLLLLLLATGFSIRNGIQSTARAQPFWVLLATGCGLWAFHQFLDLYYELGLHIEVPNSSIADPVLFLHLVPVMAAVATLPHLQSLEDKPHRWILNSFLILCFWTFLYGFVIAPYQYLPNDPGSYGVRFDILYSVENAALVVALVVSALHAGPPWRRIYLQLLGASALYALSSTIANLAADSGGYLNGKLYGLGLTASVCWFVWIPLYARGVPESEAGTTRLAEKPDLQVSGWAMLTVVLISIPSVWELLHRDENPSMRTLRLVVATAAIVLLASGAYAKEYLAKRQLATDVSLADDRLQLALQAGGTVVWEFDLKTGSGVWSGDLQTTAGTSSQKHPATVEDFLLRVHPEDRLKFSRDILQAKGNEQPYAEFRVIRRDGTVRWLTARGKFHRGRNGGPERILGVSLDVTERKQAEDALRESEEKFRSVFRDAGIGMVIVSPDGHFLAANATFCEDLGYTEEELREKTVESLTVDWQAFSARLSEALREGRGFRRVELRCRHKTGRVIDTETSASLIRDREGGPRYFVAEVVDVTARRESEEALASFNRRLIQAQEEERTRIARELHDDISQRLALLTVGLEQLKESAGGGLSNDVVKQIASVQEESQELSRNILHLSHELHSSMLEVLGLSAAMRSWCSEFAAKRKIEIAFQSHDIPASLPQEVSLNLYRVLQEALNNAAKHSGVKRFDVRLSGSAAEIYLDVSDRGKGFDIGSAMRERGLGLTSMRERLRLVNGNLAIESQPNRGTMIRARVPLRSGGRPAQTG